MAHHNPLSFPPPEPHKAPVTEPRTVLLCLPPRKERSLPVTLKSPLTAHRSFSLRRARVVSM